MSQQPWPMLVVSAALLGCAPRAHQTAPSPKEFASQDEALACARDALYSIGFTVEGVDIGARDRERLVSREYPNGFRAKHVDATQQPNVVSWVDVRAVPVKPGSRYTLGVSSLTTAPSGAQLSGSGDAVRGVSVVTAKCSARTLVDWPY
jgi:hypothetical protein